MVFQLLCWLVENLSMLSSTSNKRARRGAGQSITSRVTAEFERASKKDKAKHAWMTHQVH